MISRVFVTSAYGVSDQAWYLIVSIPDLCLLYFSNHVTFLRNIDHSTCKCTYTKTVLFNFYFMVLHQRKIFTINLEQHVERLVHNESQKNEVHILHLVIFLILGYVYVSLGKAPKLNIAMKCFNGLILLYMLERKESVNANTRYILRYFLSHAVHIFSKKKILFFKCIGKSFKFNGPGNNISIISSSLPVRGRKKL